VGRIGYGGAEHATAAADALPSWADTPARGRADLLHAAADLIAARSKEIGTLLAQEVGKRKPEAVVRSMKRMPDEHNRGD